MFRTSFTETARPMGHSPLLESEAVESDNENLRSADEANDRRVRSSTTTKVWDEQESDGDEDDGDGDGEDKDGEEDVEETVEEWEAATKEHDAEWFAEFDATHNFTEFGFVDNGEDEEDDGNDGDDGNNGNSELTVDEMEEELEQEEEQAKVEYEAEDAELDAAGYIDGTEPISNDELEQTMEPMDDTNSTMVDFDNEDVLEPWEEDAIEEWEEAEQEHEPWENEQSSESQGETDTGSIAEGDGVIAEPDGKEEELEEWEEDAIETWEEAEEEHEEPESEPTTAPKGEAETKPVAEDDDDTVAKSDDQSGNEGVVGEDDQTETAQVFVKDDDEPGWSGETEDDTLPGETDDDNTIPSPVNPPTGIPAVVPPTSSPVLPPKPVDCSGVVGHLHCGYEQHPFVLYALVAFVPLFLIWCLRKYCCRSKHGADTRGEYRVVAAQYGDMGYDNTFSDTFSDDEDDDFVNGNGDIEDSWGKSGKRTLELARLGKERNGGLTLEEMNG